MFVIEAGGMPVLAEPTVKLGLLQKAIRDFVAAAMSA